MQLEAFLEQSAQQFPEKTALVCGEQRLSFAQIEEACNRLAHGLIAMGVRRGDRVAVYLDNTVEAVVSIFAILKAGAVFMCVNPTTKAEKLTYILNNSGARVLITQSQKVKSVQACRENMSDLEAVLVAGQGVEQVAPAPERVVAWETLMAEHSERVQPPAKHSIDIDMAALIYTSGSTGNPKGVVMTHLNMVAAATSITTYLENTPDDIILNVLPLSFDYGLYQILMGFKCGGTVVLERSFTYPHAVLQRLMAERATGFPLVPTMAAILLQMDLTPYRFPCLRYITNTGAALPTHHIMKLRELFPQTKVYSMFGLTECKRVSYLPPEQLDSRPTSVGKAMPNVEVYIVNAQGQRLPPGEVGELVVRGANVMQGYWRLPEETARMLKPGPVPGEQVLHTGDLFRMDAEGYLYWIGRQDDIIKSRGEKVSPKEVENVLYGLEGVAMAAVIGVPDTVLGQAIKAMITLKEGVHLTQNDVLRHCARHLEDFMVPTLVEFCDTMPKTTTGKIDKRELAARQRLIPQ
jgi:acyl-CoA ligase (AMP-forming) (exosortase A-associated)